MYLARQSEREINLLLFDLFLLEIPHYIWKPTSLMIRSSVIWIIVSIFVHSYLNGYEIIVLFSD